MSSPSDREKELEQREQDLRDRKAMIRLQELEAELNRVEPPSLPTTQPNPQPGRLRGWQKSLKIWGQFFLIIMVTLVAVKIATKLAAMLFILAIVWLGYQLFIKKQSV